MGVTGVQLTNPAGLISMTSSLLLFRDIKLRESTRRKTEQAGRKGETDKDEVSGLGKLRRWLQEVLATERWEQPIHVL